MKNAKKPWFIRLGGRKFLLANLGISSILLLAATGAGVPALGIAIGSIAGIVSAFMGVEGLKDYKAQGKKKPDKEDKTEPKQD